MIACLLDNECATPDYMGVGPDHRKGWGVRFGRALREIGKLNLWGKIGPAVCHMPDGIDFEKNPDGSWAMADGQYTQKPYAFDAAIRARAVPELDLITNHHRFAEACRTWYDATGQGVVLYYGAGAHSPEMVTMYAASNRTAWRSRVVSVLRRAYYVRDAGVPVSVCVDTAGGRDALSQEDAIGRIVKAERMTYMVEPYSLGKAWCSLCPSITMENLPQGLPNPRTLPGPAMLIPTSVPFGQARMEWSLKREAEGWVPLVGFWPGSLGSGGGA